MLRGAWCVVCKATEDAPCTTYYVPRTTNIQSYRWFYLCLGLLLAWSLSGCSGLSLGPTPTPTPDLSAEEIIQRASRAMLAAKTLHFTIELTGALDYIDRPPITALKHVEGDLLRPDKVRGLVKVSSLGLVSEIGLISIAGQSYVTNPINQRWQALPAEWGWYFDPRLPFDEQYGIPAVAPTIQFRKAGVEQVEDEFLYHLEGVAQGEQITWWTAGLIASGDVPIGVWVDSETFLIRRVHLIELTSDPERPTEWDIQFSNFDQPVEIEAPPLKN